jgi:hypothetical protein
VNEQDLRGQYLVRSAAPLPPRRTSPPPPPPVPSGRRPGGPVFGPRPYCTHCEQLLPEPATDRLVAAINRLAAALDRAASSLPGQGEGGTR